MDNTKYILREKNAWRVKIRINNSYHNKNFYFLENGGIKKSLAKAIKHRNQILKEHKLLDRLNYKKSPDFIRMKKRLACIGVYFTVNKHNGVPATNWTARYSENEKEIKRHFSINKYGYEEAFLKACEIRYEHCGAIRVLNENLLPCKPTVPYIILN